MKRYIQHLMMCFHFRLAMWHDKHFKKHCRRHYELYSSVHRFDDWSEDPEEREGEE